MDKEEATRRLFKAAETDDVAAARAAIEAGADINFKDVNTEDRYTPLHRAVRQNSLGVLRLLLERKANVNAVDVGGSTPLHKARTLDAVQLLIAGGADVDAQNNGGSTLLHLAAYGGRFDLARLLVQNGADLDIKSRSKDTPWDALLSYSSRLLSKADVVHLLEKALKRQEGHAGRVTEERKDKGPPQVGG